MLPWLARRSCSAEGVCADRAAVVCKAGKRWWLRVCTFAPLVTWEHLCRQALGGHHMPKAASSWHRLFLDLCGAAPLQEAVRSGPVLASLRRAMSNSRGLGDLDTDSEVSASSRDTLDELLSRIDCRCTPLLKAKLCGRCASARADNAPLLIRVCAWAADSDGSAMCRLVCLFCHPPMRASCARARSSCRSHTCTANSAAALQASSACYRHVHCARCISSFSGKL